MPNIEAITAALSDAVGGPVTLVAQPSPWWHWGDYSIDAAGRVTMYLPVETSCITLSVGALDDAHAASQIVRRMVQHG